MKFFKSARDFQNEEAGAVTVDWVVLTAAVVGLGGRVARLAGAVPVLDVVERVVVVVEEVPAGDVVAEAVAVVIGAVAEGDQDVRGMPASGRGSPGWIALASASARSSHSVTNAFSSPFMRSIA